MRCAPRCLWEISKRLENSLHYEVGVGQIGFAVKLVLPFTYNFTAAQLIALQGLHRQWRQYRVGPRSRMPLFNDGVTFNMTVPDRETTAVFLGLTMITVGCADRKFSRLKV
jgi:hypothetical protein